MSEMYLYTVSTSCIDLLLNVWSICASVKQLLWSGTVEIELCYRNYSSFWVYDDTFLVSIDKIHLRHHSHVKAANLLNI